MRSNVALCLAASMSDWVVSTGRLQQGNQPLKVALLVSRHGLTACSATINPDVSQALGRAEGGSHLMGR